MKLRTWQSEALAAIEGSNKAVVWAVMGAGKSIVIASICAREEGQIVVTTPSIDLVDQLAETIAHVTGERVGKWYTHAKKRQRITVACHASLDSLTGTPDVWIADEAHKTECEGVLTWHDRCQPLRSIGFSATPWRSSESESLSLFESCVYEYGVQRALADGVVVIPTLVYPPEDSTVDQSTLDFIHAQTTPGVCNAASIVDAELFAERIQIPTLVVHSRGEKQGAIRARKFLQQGGARCVVYVSMLAEGFDCPEIQWLCARRKVGSRVRFAQEIGRGLRACEGKTECLVFDPHRLFQRLSLSYEACLGEVPPSEEVVIPVLKLDELGEDLVKQVKVSEDPRTRRALIADYVWEVKLYLQMRGALEIKLTKRAASRRATWRENLPSQKQIDLVVALYKRAARYAPQFPDRTKEVLRLAWREIPQMLAGEVSDLIDILTVAKEIK